MASPVFISLEGGEGAGKSTQAALLVRRLQDAGIRATLVHEPGTTVLGEYLRNYLKSDRPLSRESELLLFEAARAQLVTEIIQPSLTRGITVVADRFEASSVAYQGYGRRINVDTIHRLNDFAAQGRLPDFTLLLDIGPEEGLRRTGNPQLTLDLETPDLETSEPSGAANPVRQDVAGTRRFEDQPLNFHTRVRDGFLRLARSSPERWVIVDASRSADEVRDEIWSHVSARLGLPTGEQRPPEQDDTSEDPAASHLETNQPLL